MVRSATEDFESAKEHLEAQKNDLSNYLEELGRLRLQVESDSMSRFVDLCKKINNVAYKNITLDSRKVEVAPPDLNEIQVGAYRAATYSRMERLPSLQVFSRASVRGAWPPQSESPRPVRRSAL